MSRNISEATTEKTVGGQAFAARQLARRPGLRIGGFELLAVPDATALVVGDKVISMIIPRDLHLARLVDVAIFVDTVSSSGKPTVQIRNETNGNVDMLSTKVSVDVGEKSSYNAAVVYVINAANSLVHRGDRICIDRDIAGTGTKGLIVDLEFA